MISWIISGISIILLLVTIYLYLNKKTPKTEEEKVSECSHNNFVYNLLTESIENEAVGNILISDKYKKIAINNKNMKKYLIKSKSVNRILTDLDLFKKVLNMYNLEYQSYNLDSVTENASFVFTHNQSKKTGIVIMTCNDWDNLNKLKFKLNFKIREPINCNHITYVLLLDTSDS